MDMLERATRETANAPIAMGEALGQLLGYEYQRSFRGRISGVVWAASRVRISTVDKGASGGVVVCMEPFKRARARGPKGTFSPRRRAQLAPPHGVRKGMGSKRHLFTAEQGGDHVLRKHAVQHLLRLPTHAQTHGRTQKQTTRRREGADFPCLDTAGSGSRRGAAA